MINKNLIKIINLVIENNDLELPEKIELSTHLQNDLGMDSLILAELTVRIEDEFDIDIFENGIVYTIQDICDVLK
ncbi:MAG: phosphopantetheine-binding protein [Saprospiraceae bacterium]